MGCGVVCTAPYLIATPERYGNFVKWGKGGECGAPAALNVVRLRRLMWRADALNVAGLTALGVAGLTALGVADLTALGVVGLTALGVAG